jgi:hypothetical protein
MPHNQICLHDSLFNVYEISLNLSISQFLRGVHVGARSLDDGIYVGGGGGAEASKVWLEE